MLVSCLMTPAARGRKFEYQPADAGYFEKRGLRRHARVLHLWALGVAAVISGDFFGWNFGLTAGGFRGMLIALAIMTVMYGGLCFSIAEMSPALPHTGGAYSFARTAMGPWGGYITGLAENMEYILTPGHHRGRHRRLSRRDLRHPEIVGAAWWVLCYAVFVALNVYGVALSFRFSVFIAMAALAVLAVFWIGAIPHLDFQRYAFDVPSRGWKASLAALPFALWLYLGIEQLPLAAEESHDPRRDMPKGILYGLLTLIACSFLTLILSAGIAPGAAKLGASQEPLVLSFQTILAAVRIAVGESIRRGRVSSGWSPASTPSSTPTAARFIRCRAPDIFRSGFP